METVLVKEVKTWQEARDCRWKWMDLGVLCVVDTSFAPDVYRVRAIKDRYDEFSDMVMSCTDTLIKTLSDACNRGYWSVSCVDLDPDLNFAIRHRLVRYDRTRQHYVLTHSGFALVQYLKEVGLIHE